MNLLLDTQVVIWLATDNPSLPNSVRDELARHRGRLCVSVISAWEYGQKRAKHPTQLPVPFEALLVPDYIRLDFGYALHRYAETLPPIHGDPFDRMLIAQAMASDMTLVTADNIVRSYPVSTYWQA